MLASLPNIAGDEGSWNVSDQLTLRADDDAWLAETQGCRKDGDALRP